MTISMIPSNFPGDWISILADTAQAYVAKKNAELLAWRNSAIESYNLMAASGSYTVVPALSPVQHSYVFVPADLSPSGLPTWTQDGPLVTGTIPVATVNNGTLKPSGPNAAPLAPGEAATFQIGIQFAPGWYQVGQDDTEPAGFQRTIPDADGKLITVRKNRLPWGSHYEVIG